MGNNRQDSVQMRTFMSHVHVQALHVFNFRAENIIL